MSSLPTLAGRKQPSRPATHKSLDLGRMMKLGLEVEELAETTAATPEGIAELASELGVPASHLYAAAAATTEVEFSQSEAVSFVICAGKCQEWGSLACLEHLLDERDNRADEGRPLFNIRPRTCLDKCQHAPVVLVHSPDGTAVLGEVTPAKLTQAIEEVCDHE